MRSFRSLVAGCLILHGYLASELYQNPPSDPSIFTFDNWRVLTHTDQPTFTDADAPVPPVSESWKDPTAEIFVGIVSYRDRRCSQTLANLFDKAEFPDRVRVGVVEQVQTEEDSFSCIVDYCKLKRSSIDHNCPHRDQISIIQLTHNMARGPNFARYMQESLRQNEEFCMQVDAHSDFAPHWDTLQTQMWGSVQNEYAVLSSTPADIAVLRRPSLNNEDQVVPHLCQAKVDERDMIVSLPPTLAAHLPRPILAPLYAAGNVFSKCHAVEKVPSDPALQMIFEADEFPTYARLWTRGYDVYTPNKIAVTHDYYDKMASAAANPADKTMEWATRRPGQAQFNRYLYERSLERISTLLGFPGSKRDLLALTTLTRYGLGHRRSLEQFIEFTGVDTRKRMVVSDRCEELKWVPFTAPADPYADSLDVWGGAPEILPAGANIAISGSAESVTVYPLDAFENSYTDALAYIASGAGGSSGGGNGGLNNLHYAPPISMKDSLNNLNKLNPLHNEKLNAEAKYLRAKMQQYVGEARVELKKDMKEIGEVVKHRGSELWWLFQPLDSALEGVMNRLDQDFGPGMGSKVMKLVLLLIPLFLLVLVAAHRMLVTGEDEGSSGTGRRQQSSGKLH